MPSEDPTKGSYCILVTHSRDAGDILDKDIMISKTIGTKTQRKIQKKMNSRRRRMDWNEHQCGWRKNTRQQHTGEIVVYLADTCIPVSATSGRTRRHSAVHCDLVVPRTRLARYGSRGFVVSGPVTWRSLPPDLRIMSVCCQFIQPTRD